MSKKFLTPIKLAQGASNPAVGSAGELFFNTTDVKVYAHNGTSWVPSGGGVTVSATAPATPIAGDAWYDTVDGTLYVYYNDGDSSQWVEVAANSGISVALEGRLGVVETYVTTLQSEMDTAQDDINALEALFPVSIASGGTGASTLAEAQNSLGVGLVNIVPPTVNFSGGTATSNSLNEIVFSGVTSFSLNNVFSSDYSNYKIVLAGGLAGTSNGINLQFQLRQSGANRTSAYYANGVVQVGTTAPAASFFSNSSSYSSNNLSTAAYNAQVMEIIGPHVSSRPTTILNQANGASGSALFRLVNGGIHDVAESHDGFTFFVASGTISGTVQVFGYNS
jgi:hypothetical protein